MEIWSQGSTVQVPMGFIAYDKAYGVSTAGLKPGQQLTAARLPACPGAG